MPVTGVLMLNAVLTVRAHEANSHKDCGWEQFTDAVIAWLNKHTAGTVFMLWGSYAQKKGSCIDKASIFCLYCDCVVVTLNSVCIFECRTSELSVV